MRLAHMTKVMQKMPNIRLALVNYPGAQRAALYGLADAFALLPRLSETSLPAVNITFVTEDTLPEDIQTAILFPPSIDTSRPPPSEPLLAWARNQHTGGAMACSICAGAFWLAEAGLLSGRPATTHWALEEQFRDTYPDVDLRPEHILVNDHDVVTAGGLMAWLDMVLFLTDLWFGPVMVSRLARHLLIDPAGREQRHYSSFRPNRTHSDTAILAVQRHMDQAYASSLLLHNLAAQAHLSLRTFQRRFQAATGLPPTAYLQALRVEKARGTLEHTNQSIAQIAWSVGYGDPAAFTRAFRNITGVTPGTYRTRFGIRASAPLPLAPQPTI